MEDMPNLLDIYQTAEILKCKAPSLRDNRYRARLGLRAVRIGGRLMFEEADIRDMIERRKERFDEE